MNARDFIALAKPGLVGMVTVSAAAGYAMGMPSGVEWSCRMTGWPPLASSWIAFGLAMLGIGGAAAGAAALNMAMERDVDALMERTKNRPVAAGRVSLTAAVGFGGMLLLGGLSLTSFISLRAGLASGLAALLYLGAYTPMKRRSPLSLFAGAFVGALGPVAGYAAGGGESAAAAFALGAFLYTWQLPHFLAIARRYREDYHRAGLLTYAEGEDGKRSMALSLVFSLLVLPVSLIPAAIDLVSQWYTVGAVLLYALFLPSLVSYRRGEPFRLYRATILYLPLMLTLMVLAKR